MLVSENSSSNPSPDTPIVELAGAVSSLQTPELVLLENVQWTIRKGDYWVVGGPPGAGKSDLLATAAGLIRPARGSHRLFGQDLTRLHEEERVRLQLRVGVVFGLGGRLFTHLTVAENLALPLCYHQDCALADATTRVNQVLEAMSLSHVRDHRPAQLDRNLQQRAALARSLVLSPEALFLDSALVGTGPREVRWWLEFLEMLRRGHPLLEGRPLTLVVGTSELQHWSEHGSQFALVQRRQFVAAPSREDLTRQSDLALRELLPAAWLKT